MYSQGGPLICDVLFCFLSEVPVTNWAAQYLVEYVKSTVQNIANEGTPQSVRPTLLIPTQALQCSDRRPTRLHGQSSLDNTMDLLSDICCILTIVLATGLGKLF